MKLLVNIRGCNGAGKSTIPMAMLNDKKLRVIGIGKKNMRGTSTKPFITIFPSYRWVALGTYYNKTGGMDTYGTNQLTRDALEYAWNQYPEYDILMEGVIASTILSTYVDLFKKYRARVTAGVVTPRKIIVMNFLPPVKTCIDRVYERNGGRPVKEDQIQSKWNTVYKNALIFKQEGFTSLKVDTSKIPKEKMLLHFLAICDKYREG